MMTYKQQQTDGQTTL